MDKMEPIRKLVEQLAEECKNVFPESNDLDFSMADGYRRINICVQDKNPELPTGAWKYRHLWLESKVNGKWQGDTSADQNKYLRERKLLLEEG